MERRCGELTPILAELAENEARLAQAKAEAVKNLAAVALEATRLATQRLIGLAPPEADVKRAIEAALAERRG